MTIVPIALSFLQAADHSQRGTNRREDGYNRLNDEFYYVFFVHSF